MGKEKLEAQLCTTLSSFIVKERAKMICNWSTGIGQPAEQDCPRVYCSHQLCEQ
jgi:hypothetical protein